MKLTLNNIKFVKRFTKNGETRSYYVGMKSGYVSDARQFYVTKKTDLPVNVQKFLNNTSPEVFDKDYYNDDEYVTYIYR